GARLWMIPPLQSAARVAPASGRPSPSSALPMYTRSKHAPVTARRSRVEFSSPGNLLHLAGRLFWRFLLFLFGLFSLTGLPLLLLVRHRFLLHKLRLAGILALTAVSARRAILSRHRLSSGLGQTGPAASSYARHACSTPRSS